MFKRQIAIFSLTLIIAGILAAGGVSVSAQQTQEAPVLVSASKTAAPGSVIGLYGEFLDGADVTVFNGVEARVLSPVNAQDDVIQCLLPEDWATGVYRVTVATEAGSAETYINRAEAFWVSEQEAHAGQELRIVGRNLYFAEAEPQVWLEKDSMKYPAAITGRSAYAIDFQIPDVTEGDYDVLVTNGLEKNAGESRLAAAVRIVPAGNSPTILSLVGIDAAWLREIPAANWFDVTDYGARGDGDRTEDSAFSNAAAAVTANGGGILYVPAGVYRLRSFAIPENCILLGESKDSVTISYAGGRKPSDSATGTYGESINFITPSGSHAGVANLTIENTVSRPEEDTRRRIFGWLRPIVLVRSGGKGYFVKNVNVRNVDGIGIYVRSEQGLIIEDCDIQVSHSALFLEQAGGNPGHARIVDNSMQNALRPLVLATSASLWLEGNEMSAQNHTAVYSGDEDPYRTDMGEHRIADLNADRNYIANNQIKGQFGTYDRTVNDGEGLLFQQGMYEGDRIVFERVTSSSDNTLTGGKNSWGEDELAGMVVTILDGRGKGQRREILSNTKDTIKVGKPWDVVPDESSCYVIYSACPEKNIITGNQVNASTFKGGIMFYNQSYDNIVADNTLTNTGGIWFAQSGNPDSARADYSMFNLVEGNRLSGASNYKVESDGFQGNCLSIGTGNDGGIGTSQSNELPALGVYGNEYRNNSLTGIGKSVTSGGSSNARFSQRSGIMVSTQSAAAVPAVKGLILEGNEVSNAIAGVHISNSASDTVLNSNHFRNNAQDVSDWESVRTVYAGQPTFSNVIARTGLDGSSILTWREGRKGTYLVRRCGEPDGIFEAIGTATEPYFQDDEGKPGDYYQVIPIKDGQPQMKEMQQAQAVVGFHAESVGEAPDGGRTGSLAFYHEYLISTEREWGTRVLKREGGDWTQLSYIELPGSDYQAKSVAVSGHFLLLGLSRTGGWGCIQIYDIREPENPVLMQTIAALSPGIQIVGNLAFVSDSSNGFRILDLTGLETGTVKQLSVTQDEGSVSGVCPAGNILFVKTYWGNVAAYDVSDPKAPVLLDRVSFTYTDSEGEQEFLPTDMALAGEQLYLTFGTVGGPNRIVVLDVSNPEDMQVAAETEPESARLSKIMLREDLAFVGMTDGKLRVYDIASEVPRLLVTLDVSSDSIAGLEEQNGRLIVSCGYDGFKSFLIPPVVLWENKLGNHTGNTLSFDLVRAAYEGSKLQSVICQHCVLQNGESAPIEPPDENEKVFLLKSLQSLRPLAAVFSGW